MQLPVLAAALLAAAVPRGALGLLLRQAANSSCPLPPGARWCRVQLQNLPAFDMAVYAASDIVSNQICMHGHWEMSNMAELGPPGKALDVGGNVGYYSLSLAAAGWTVTTFEPLSQNVALIEASLCRNPALAARVKLYNVGLGPSNTQCTIISDNNNVGDGVTKCGSNASHVPMGYSVRGSFGIRRLDDVMAQDGVGNFDFVKLDVEGYECQVFAGASKLLSGHKPRLIQSEVWPNMKGCTPAGYLQMFTNSGYTVSKDINCHTPDANVPASISDFFMCYRGPAGAASLLARQPQRRILRLSLA